MLFFLRMLNFVLEIGYLGDLSVNFLSSLGGSVDQP